MPRRYDSQDAKRRILAVCVRLFLEKGYTATRMVDIIREADVSTSTFQNIFHTKDGVLFELMQDMFSGQFSTAERLAIGGASPVVVYAVETAIQLTMTEMNPNIREVYMEAYTNRETVEFINRQTANRLHMIFGRYLPNYSVSDFYEMDIGSAGLMSAYMARSCDLYFTLEHKIERFLFMSLAAYRVPPDEINATIAYVKSLDIRKVAQEVLQNLFTSLAMHYPLESKTSSAPDET